MKDLRAWLLCLLLLGLALRGAASHTHQHSMEIRSECRTPGGSLPHPLSPPQGHLLTWGIVLAKCPSSGGLACCSPALPQSGPVQHALEGFASHYQGGLESSRLCTAPAQERGAGSWSQSKGEFEFPFPKAAPPSRPSGCPSFMGGPPHVLREQRAKSPRGEHLPAGSTAYTPGTRSGDCSHSLSSPGRQSCLVHGPQDQAGGPLWPEESGPEECPKAPAGRLPPGRRR